MPKGKCVCARKRQRKREGKFKRIHTDAIAKDNMKAIRVENEIYTHIQKHIYQRHVRISYCGSHCVVRKQVYTVGKIQIQY